MKTIILFLFLPIGLCLARPVDFTALNQVPSQRAAAYKAYQRSTNGTPEERGKGMQKYVDDLRGIVVELRDRYYTRSGSEAKDEDLLVTDEMLKSVEQMALLIENIKYPQNIAAGSSLWYEKEVHARKVRLLEMIILRMSRAIVQESWNWQAPGTPRSSFDYKAWLEAWYASVEEIPVPDAFD